MPDIQPELNYTLESQFSKFFRSRSAKWRLLTCYFIDYEILHIRIPTRIVTRADQLLYRLHLW